MEYIYQKTIGFAIDGDNWGAKYIYIQNLGVNIGEHMLINNFLSFIYFLKDDDFLDPPLLPSYNEGP